MWWVFLVLFFYCNTSQSNERIRPRNFSELRPEGQANAFLPVNGASLAYVNYTALRRDFPALKTLNDQAIDAWILENYAYISLSQYRLNNIRNTVIDSPFGAHRLTAMRMPWGGRSAVFKAFLNQNLLGLIDLKGIGIGNFHQAFRSLHIYWNLKVRKERGEDIEPELDKLRALPYSDGLMSLGEAIAETSRQQAAQMLFDLDNDEHQTAYETVETYFIIALPFQILKEGEQSEPAAIYGRQAHFGRNSGFPFPKKILIDNYGGRQSTLFQALIDFGGVMIQDPRLIPLFTDPFAGGDPKNPQHSLAWAKGHEVARDFLAGNAQAVYQHLRMMLSPIESAWVTLGDRIHLIRDPIRKALVESTEAIEQGASIRSFLIRPLQVGQLYADPYLIAKKMTPAQALEVLNEKAKNPKFEFDYELILKAVGERNLHTPELEPVLIKIITNPIQSTGVRLHVAYALHTNETMSQHSIATLLKMVRNHRLLWPLRLTIAEALIESHSIFNGDQSENRAQELELFYKTILSIADKNLVPLQKSSSPLDEPDFEQENQHRVDGTLSLLDMLKANAVLKRTFMENHFDLVNRMIQILVESLNVDGALEEAALYEKRYAILLKIKDLLSFFSSEPKDHVAHQQFVTIAKTQGRYILKQIFYELKHSNSLSYNRLLASLLQSSAYRELVGIHLDFSVASLIQIIEPGSEEKPEFNALPILGDILADHTLGPLSAPAKREILKFLNKIKRGKIDFLESSVLSQQVKNVTQTLLNRDRLKQTVAACRAALKSSD